MTDSLHQLSALELLDGYRRRAFSPVEVLRDVLAQIARWEPALDATYLLKPDAALAAARASEARWLRRRPIGALDGVPITIKDNIATQGDPVPLGTRATPLVPAAADAPPAARVHEAGAVLISKTTMPDYGMLSSGLSTFHRITRNPWDVSRTPGGSSAGAGAACAAGYGPLHIGTDIGGSIRLPAGWCGIVGLKPSLGRVPIDPPFMGRAAGPMTRDVADAALLMQVLSGTDARDSMNLPPQRIDWAAVWKKPKSLRGLRIGLLLDAGCGLPVTPAIRAAIEDAAQRFEAEGAIVTPLAPFMTTAMLAGLDRFWRMRSLVDMRALTENARDSVLPVIRTWAESADAMSGTEVFQAYAQTHATRVAANQAMQGLDYVLSPTAPCPPAPFDWASPTNDPLRGLEHIGFTVPFNMGEQPAISVNAGYDDDGLPIGLQIAGQRFDDLGVLQMARAFEGLRAPQRPWPEPPAE